MINADADVLDVPAVMTMLKLGRNAVYEACARNEIPHRRIGKLLRFSRSGLQRWIEGDSTFRTMTDVRSSSACGRSQVAQKGH